MASEKQIAANRKNAAKSTGPRTKNGKARSKMNALRHGLATSNLIDASNRNEKTFASESWERLVAENFEVLQKIRAERTRLTDQILNAASSPNDNSEVLGRIAALQRYEGKAYAIRKKLHYRSDQS